MLGPSCHFLLFFKPNYKLIGWEFAKKFITKNLRSATASTWP